MEETGIKSMKLENIVTNCDHFKSITLLRLYPSWMGLFLFSREIAN